MFARETRFGVRPPAVAGSFYPRNSKELRAAMAALLDEAPEAALGELVGVLAPHAGYIYSGPVAASAFAAVAKASKRFARVLLVGPPHYLPVSGIAASSAKAFATPLGEVPVDLEAVAALLDAGLAAVDDRAHAPEHSLEVELPFLQTVLGDFVLIPLLVGNVPPERVASIIATMLDQHTLLVVSTDLSHYLDDASARARDFATAETIERLDCARLGPQDACGFAALNGALRAAADHPWRVERLDLRNSGATSGDNSRVVGYGAWAMLRTESSVQLG
jgi:AmmeMemoRadiSam system protein B